MLLACVGLLGCSETLHHDLDETRANELVHALRSASIAADKVRDADGRWQVRAPSTQTRRALALMLREGLPRRAEDLSTQFAESSGFVPNPEDDRSRRLVLVQRRLERSLESMPGVLEARVHAVLPRSERRGVLPPPPRASVLLVVREGALPPEEMQIRALLAGAIDALEPEGIAIVHASRPVPEVPLAAVVRIGGIAVLEESRGALVGLLGAVAVTVGLLVAALIGLWRRTLTMEDEDE